MWGKIKLRRDDILFSQYLRKKRNYICEVCKRFFPQGHGLQVSHFWSRKHECTRFSEVNCDIACIGDHMKFEQDPALYADWKLKKLGQKEYNKLKLAVHLSCKKDIIKNVMIIKKLSAEIPLKTTQKNKS